MQTKILDLIQLEKIKLIVTKLDDICLINLNDEEVIKEKDNIIYLKFVDQFLKFRIYENGELVKNENFDLKPNFIQMFTQEGFEYNK